MIQSSKHGKIFVTILFILIYTFNGCTTSPGVEDPSSVTFLKRYYGATDATIQALAREYGVAVTEISTFGAAPFPVNFIRQQLNWVPLSGEHPVVYRREVEALVKGYVAKCRIANTIVLYLFYSNRLAPRGIFTRDTSALVMDIGYRFDPDVQGEHDDQILEDISYHDLGDDGGYDWSKVATQCIPPART